MEPGQTITASLRWSHLKPSRRGQLRLSRPQKRRALDGHAPRRLDGERGREPGFSTRVGARGCAPTCWGPFPVRRRGRGGVMASVPAVEGACPAPVCRSVLVAFSKKRNPTVSSWSCSSRVLAFMCHWWPAGQLAGYLADLLATARSFEHATRPPTSARFDACYARAALRMCPLWYPARK